MYRNHAASSEQTNKQLTAVFLVRAWEAISTTEVHKTRFLLLTKWPHEI
jgi:hypothetical protein